MEMVFYTFCAFLPIHLLAYLPFLDILRFGKRWMELTVVGNLLAHLLGTFWAVQAGRMDLLTVVGMAMVPLSLALYFLNIRLSPGKLLFTYMLLVNYQIIAMGFSAFLADTLLHAPVRGWESGLFCLLIFILAWRPMYRLFRYAADQVYRHRRAPAVAGHLAAPGGDERDGLRAQRRARRPVGAELAVSVFPDRPACVRGAGLQGAGQLSGRDPKAGDPPGAAQLRDAPAADADGGAEQAQPPDDGTRGAASPAAP